MKELIDLFLKYGLLSIASDVSNKCPKMSEDEIYNYINKKYNISLSKNDLKLTKKEVDMLDEIDKMTGYGPDRKEINDKEVIDEKDIQNARETFLKLTHKEDVFLSRFVPYFSIGILVIGFIYLFMASFSELSQSNASIVQSTIEFVKTILIMVSSFWVGSSVGSKLKTNKISELSKPNQY